MAKNINHSRTYRNYLLNVIILLKMFDNIKPRFLKKKPNINGDDLIPSCNLLGVIKSLFLIFLGINYLSIIVNFETYQLVLVII